MLRLLCISIVGSGVVVIGGGGGVEVGGGGGSGRASDYRAIVHTFVFLPVASQAFVF